MTNPNDIDAGRLSIMLNELRLPAIKMLWADFAQQADREGFARGPLPIDYRRA